MVFRLRSAHRGGPSFFHGDRTRRIGEKRAYRTDMKPEELKTRTIAQITKKRRLRIPMLRSRRSSKPMRPFLPGRPSPSAHGAGTLLPYLIGGYLGWVEHHLRSIVPYKVAADERPRALVLDVAIDFAYAIIVFTLFFKMVVFLHDFIR